LGNQSDSCDNAVTAVSAGVTRLWDRCGIVQCVVNWFRKSAWRLCRGQLCASKIRNDLKWNNTAMHSDNFICSPWGDTANLMVSCVVLPTGKVVDVTLTQAFSHNRFIVAEMLYNNS